MQGSSFAACLILAGAGLSACRATLPASRLPPPPTPVAQTVLDPSWTTPAGGLPLAGAGAAAPTEDIPLSEVETEGPLEVFATLTSTYGLGGDLSDGTKGFDKFDNRLRLSLEKPASHFARYTAAVQYGSTGYSFSGANAFVPGTTEPWDRVQALSLSLKAFQPVHEHWAVVAEAGVGWSAANGAGLGDGRSWWVIGGVGHRLTDTLDVGVGAIVGERFAEELYVFGGPQFSWKPFARWRLALEGAEVDLSYQPRDGWELGLSGGFASDRFRLRDELPQDGRIVTDSRLPVWLRLRHGKGRHTDIELRVGTDLYRDVIIENRFGRAGVAWEADPAPFVSLRWIQRL